MNNDRAYIPYERASLAAGFIPAADPTAMDYAKKLLICFLKLGIE